jgi:transcription elongation GreA/GreB family factor
MVEQSMVRIAVLEERLSSLIDREEQQTQRYEKELHELRQDLQLISRQLAEMSEMWAAARTTGRVAMGACAALGALLTWIGFDHVRAWFGHR